MTDAAYAALIELVADICKRNGINKLLWKADKSLIGQVDKQNMTVHRWFANKACPGDYLYQRHGAIAEAVNAKLGTGTEQTVSSFPAVPFTVRVIINDLNYREGPGMSYAVKGQTGKGVFTITEVQDGWGKLKSGAGWIYLENPTYCTILDDGQTEAQKAAERLAQDIAAQLKKLRLRCCSRAETSQRDPGIRREPPAAAGGFFSFIWRSGERCTRQRQRGSKVRVRLRDLHSK